MIRIILIVSLAFTCAANADDFATQRSKVTALGELTTAPQVMTADGFEEADNIRPIYFNALPYEGKPTKVFAWLGLPEQSQADSRDRKTVPGIVLVHGGGGTAFREWVKRWNDHGFAAISIAHEGQLERREASRKWAKHDWPGPWRRGHYQDVDKPIEDQWMYHALADTILANSLLRSLPEVNPDQVGVMGVSWGGVITSTVMGIDSRFAFAIPTYGCGDMADAENHWGRALGNNDFYRQVWDPVNYLPDAKMPAMWFSWPRDNHFPLGSQAASYRATKGPNMVVLLPGMRHSSRASWTPPDSYAFAKSIVADQRPWCLQTRSNVNGERLTVVFDSTKPLEQASIISTKDTGFTGNRNWTE
ncbi:MAG: alpha/beta hydrolase family protein, partial [Rhodopirellula sp. JB044]|uniref:alpha/beta hydrolase family protein n=1 Tax=Rhodopirellula sp. JB044 TaxID=3342844 RepID=UPI00370A4B31